MSQEVQEALEEPRFEVVVPFNNELMIERRKRIK